ncbi:MAG: hypothetical protein LUC90_02930, partial [Lachnospiraceae bacterium]|nr:hypothetical protein [Lachnospiraceae bacterium]
MKSRERGAEITETAKSGKSGCGESGKRSGIKRRSSKNTREKAERSGMADKDLRRMNHGGLIEIIYALQNDENTLRKEIDDLRRQRDDKLIRLNQAGSIAEAALSLNHIFEDAQNASRQYLDSIAALNARGEEQANEIVEKARQQAEEVKKEAQEQARITGEEAENKHEEARKVLVNAQEQAKKAQEEIQEIRAIAHEQAEQVLKEAQEEADKSLAEANEQAQKVQKDTKHHAQNEQAEAKAQAGSIQKAAEEAAA